MPTRALFVIFTLCLALGLGCQSAETQRQSFLVLENMGNAHQKIEAGQNQEAAQILQIVLLAEPENGLARDELAALPVDITPLYAPSIFGINLRPAVPKRDVGTRLLLYPVNRILDLLDIVSFSVGTQGGAYVDVHATQAMTAKLGFGGGGEIGWWQKRDLGLGASHVAGTALGPVSAVAEGISRFGSNGAGNSKFELVGSNSPYDEPFQRFHDYWGVGVRVIAGVVGVSIDLHPMELADFVAGFGTVDFLRDDFGSYENLRYTAGERQAMYDLLDSLTKKQRDDSMKYLRAHPVRPDLSAPTSPTATLDTPPMPLP